MSKTILVTGGAVFIGDVEQTWADVSKAKELLGYSPNYDLEKRLENFGEWYKSHYHTLAVAK